MRSRFKSKKLKGAAVALLLLPLCVMGCAGNSDAQSEAPLSPYELENMIMSNDADIADKLSDIQEIKAALADIEATDYSDEVADILSRLADIEARLNPTPTPTATTPSGSPVPTATPATGDITVTVLDKPAAVAATGSYDFTIRIENDSPSHAVCTVTLTLNAYNVDCEVADATADIDEETETAKASYYLPSMAECEQVRMTMEGIALGSGSSKVLTVSLDLTQTGSFEWIPSFSIAGN